MTIDYQHPLILKMKNLYKEGYEAQDLIFSILNSEGPGWRERRRKATDIAREKLHEALMQIPELINKMRDAKDLPEDERNYYVPFMGEHLESIRGWFERLPKD
ncbi:hypothetical protein HYT25_04975 [Candidatus Pacearchaeota archaeon]|nr:hypothetical protein [Candidatus Pacearchaeota archaeon]